MKNQQAPEPPHTKRGGAAACRLLLLLFALAMPTDAMARQTGQALLRGRVVDAGTGAGVEGADVVLQNRHAHVVTDGRGRFRFDLVRPGRYPIEVRRLGYQTRSDTLEIPAGTSLEVTLEISAEVTVLPGIEVVARSLVLESKGFYDRQRQGFRGVFLDRTAIEKYDPIYVPDLFKNIPGVEVLDGRLVMSQSVTLMGGGRGCEPSLWLDGIRSGLRNYNFIRPDHLEGVEVYTGAGAPEKYNDLCGTVVIWTRVPIRSRS